jgi:Flp pilus assembly pilin Flp
MKFSQIRGSAARGQSLVEYTLIVVLVVIAIALALTLVPLENAISNVFDDAIAGVMNGTVTPRSTLSETEFWRLVTEVASITPQTRIAATNTIPAGGQPTNTPTLAPTNTPAPTVTGTPPTPTSTPTQRPPATPVDTEHSYPFYDSGDRLGVWHIGFSNVINQTALWTVSTSTIQRTPIGFLAFQQLQSTCSGLKISIGRGQAFQMAQSPILTIGASATLPPFRWRISAIKFA